MRNRGSVQVQMEILASLFASPKPITRLAQACNVNTGRISAVVEPLLAKGLVRREARDGQEVLVITEDGYRLYKDWLDVWRRLEMVT